MFRILQRFELALTPALARKAAVALVVAYGAALVLWLVTAPGGVRPDGSPVGSDFVLFHAAGRLALRGALASAYDGAAISAVEQAAVPGESLVYLWRYPPPLALLLLPLGALPYFVAYALWSCAGLAAFVGGVRRLLRGRDGLLLALGAPATFVCILHGQTAFLTAAAFAWGLALLERRPMLAGAIFSLLVCKPHFAVLVPVLLLVGGRYRALGGFLGGAAALCGASLVAFGWAPWAEFLRTGPQMQAFLAQGGISWAKVPSVFIFAMSLHAPQALALALQGAASLAVLATAVLVWRHGEGFMPLKGAVAVTAALLISPYVVDYDLTLLVVAAALLIGSGTAVRPGVRTALLCAFATPVVAPALMTLTGVQLGAAPLLALFAVLGGAYWSEARLSAGSATGSGGPARFTTRWVG